MRSTECGISVKGRSSSDPSIDTPHSAFHTPHYLAPILTLRTMTWLTSPETWIALLTLTVLEIVLGIDNIIFISILAGKLPAGDQQLRPPPPDAQDARTVLPLAHRRHAHRRRPRPAHPEGLRLFRDGLLGVRRVAQPAPAAQGAARAPERVDHPVTPFVVRSCSTVLLDAFFLSVVPPDIELDHLLPVGPVVRPPVPDPQRVPDSLAPESS